METLIGIVIGIIATIVVSHYYFRRSTRKSLGVYELLNTLIFAGIEKEVREQLHFSFRGREVQELQQVQFLIANDGERAISNIIEALTLALPQGMTLLDASILHRHPKTLDVIIHTEEEQGKLEFRCPLLNKGEFFVAKLLLDGEIPRDKLEFRVLADDLPRTLKMQWLPPTALDDKKPRMEWGGIVAGIIIIGVALWLGYVGFVLRAARPDLFPYPWNSFHPSSESLLVLIPGAVLILLIGIIGIVVLVATVFSELPFPRGPRFPLPKELRHRAFRFPFPQSFLELEGVSVERETKKDPKA